jgi:hypothetical protein
MRKVILLLLLLVGIIAIPTLVFATPGYIHQDHSKPSDNPIPAPDPVGCQQCSFVKTP